MAKRYVLRYRRKGEIPAGDIDQIARLSDVSIAEQSARMLFVEGPESVLQEFADTHPDWLLFPEQTYSVPDARHKIKGE